VTWPALRCGRNRWSARSPAEAGPRAARSSCSVLRPSVTWCVGISSVSPPCIRGCGGRRQRAGRGCPCRAPAVSPRSRSSRPPRSPAWWEAAAARTQRPSGSPCGPAQTPGSRGRRPLTWELHTPSTLSGRLSTRVSPRTPRRSTGRALLPVRLRGRRRWHRLSPTQIPSLPPPCTRRVRLCPLRARRGMSRSPPMRQRSVAGAEESPTRSADGSRPDSPLSHLGCPGIPSPPGTRVRAAAPSRTHRTPS
jgi:hypothetical protein